MTTDLLIPGSAGYHFVGWRIEAPPEAPQTLFQRVSRYVAQCFLQLAALFSKEREAICNVYEYDAKARAWEHFSTPVHSHYLHLREALVDFSYPLESASILDYLVCLIWNTERDIVKTLPKGAEYVKKMPSLPLQLVTEVNRHMLALRDAVHKIGSCWSAAIIPLRWNYAYSKAKADLHTTFVALHRHFQGVPAASCMV